jgi:hypothetical protein
LRRHPHLYEANAFIFLKRLSQKYHRSITLSTIPDDEWSRLANMGFDLVWLMGVWQRSPAARKEALGTPELRQEYGYALPGWTEADVTGSPYAVYSYTLDPALGGEDELKELKARLNSHGIGLVLDFVPNHWACDNPWTLTYPNRFIQDSSQSIRKSPGLFYSPDGKNRFAHGKDPYFPPWTDTVQVNIFSQDMREAMAQELLKIASVCDGVRCDMAMLVLNEIFEKTWGWLLKGQQKPQTEFWQEAIEQVKQRYPDFLFIAESYWGLERRLQQLGFDFTYDKELYDALLSSGAHEIKERLLENGGYQGRLVRFIENHDETRALTAFGRDKSRAATIVMATIPGLRFFHDGQLEGRRIKLPVQLGREPLEPTDQQVASFYQRLLTYCDAPAFHEGQWSPLSIGRAWDGNESYGNLLAWSWRHDGQLKIVVVNYSSSHAQGRIHISGLPSDDGHIELTDALHNVRYVRDLHELRTLGLYVDLAPWSAHLLGTGEKSPVPSR